MLRKDVEVERRRSEGSFRVLTRRSLKFDIERKASMALARCTEERGARAMSRV